MNQFIYLLKPARLGMLTDATPGEVETVSRHFEHLKNLKADGRLILAGRTQNTDESTFGICIFEAENEDEARSIMENDPAVRGGVMTASLFPYKVALSRE